MKGRATASPSLAQAATATMAVAPGGRRPLNAARYVRTPRSSTSPMTPMLMTNATRIPRRRRRRRGGRAVSGAIGTSLARLGGARLLLLDHPRCFGHGHPVRRARIDEPAQIAGKRHVVSHHAVSALRSYEGDAGDDLRERRERRRGLDELRRALEAGHLRGLAGREH